MKVTISGTEYAFGFSMAVMIKFEELFGVEFDIEEISQSIKKQTTQMQICYASLSAYNESLPFTYDEMLRDLSIGETVELKNAVIPTMSKWFEIPKVMQNDDQPQQEQDEKND